MQRQLLYYGFEKNRLETLLKTADEFEIGVKEVRDEEVGQKVKALFGLCDYEEVSEETVPKIEFLLFSDFDRDILKKYLLSLKEREVTVAHKAVMTETSKEWKFSYLLEHIMDEHEIVKMFNELGILIKKAQRQLDTQDDENLREALEYALSIREINGVEKEDVSVRYEKLKEAMNG